MKNYEQLAIEFAEKYGIIEYKLKDSTMTYYRRNTIDCYGHYKTSKHMVDLNTMTEKVIILQRNILKGKF